VLLCRGTALPGCGWATITTTAGAQTSTMRRLPHTTGLPANSRTMHRSESTTREKYTGGVTSVADPGCLSRIPDPDFCPSRIPDPRSRISDPGYRIPDPKIATKERGEKNFVVLPFFVATKIAKL
jgi:hypothetical protein